MNTNSKSGIASIAGNNGGSGVRSNFTPPTVINKNSLNNNTATNISSTSAAAYTSQTT